MTTPKVTFETIDVAKAEKILENNRLNRPLNDQNLAALVAEMKKGNFYLTGESIKISKTDMLLDGQHRLMAVVKSKIPMKTMVVRGLEEEAVQYIDTGKSRTASDILGMENCKNPTATAAIIKVIMNFQNGDYANTAYHLSKGKKKITNREVLNFYNKHRKSIEESYLAGKDNKLMPPSLLSGLHFIFKQINWDEADDFCHKLSKGTNLTSKSPIYHLREILISNQLSHLNRMRPIMKLTLICKAWNLYRENKKVSSLSIDPKEPFPKPI